MSVQDTEFTVTHTYTVMGDARQGLEYVNDIESFEEAVKIARKYDLKLDDPQYCGRITTTTSVKNGEDGISARGGEYLVSKDGRTEKVDKGRSIQDLKESLLKNIEEKNKPLSNADIKGIESALDKAFHGAHLVNHLARASRPIGYRFVYFGGDGFQEQSIAGLACMLVDFFLEVEQGCGFHVIRYRKYTTFDKYRELEGIVQNSLQTSIPHVTDREMRSAIDMA